MASGDPIPAKPRRSRPKTSSPSRRRLRLPRYRRSGPRWHRSHPYPPRPVKIAPPIPRTPLVIVPPHVGNMPAAQAEPAGARRKARLWWEGALQRRLPSRDGSESPTTRSRERCTSSKRALESRRAGLSWIWPAARGAHAVQLARRGYREVVGFDLSLAMLARAGEDAQEREAKLNFVQGDMRDMTFEEQFDGVYCWNTSFGYFEEDKNAQVIDRVHRALKGGGLFLLDVVNRDFLVRQSPSLAWFEGEGCICMDEMTVDFITSRMKVKRTMMMLDDGSFNAGDRVFDAESTVCTSSGRRSCTSTALPSVR